MSGDAFHRGLRRDALFARGDVYRIARDDERAARTPLRVALLGAGGVAQTKYLPALARLQAQWEPVELVALSTLDPVQRNRLAASLRLPLYADSERLLADHRPDAVLVTSSDTAHRELTLAALGAGAHVLVEKPIAPTLLDAAEMERAAEAAERVLLAVCNKRFSPPYAQAKALIDEGALAHPSLCHARFVLGYDDVSLLESGTVHLFDLLRFLLGDVTRVRALAPPVRRPERRGGRPESALVAVEFASGAAGSLITSATALSLHPWERIELFGDGAWLEVDDQLELRFHPGEYEPTRSWRPVVPNTLVSAEEWGGYVGLVDDFLQAARGTPSRVTGPGDGYRALELVVATRLSLRRNEAVVLPLNAAEATVELAG